MCDSTDFKNLEEYPERKIHVIDSLNASAGAGMMVYMARDMQKAGVAPEEIVKHIEGIKSSFKAIFVVDDLQYLVRGGRLSAFSGAVGTILDIFKSMNPDKEYIAVVYTKDENAAKEYAARIENETGITVKHIIPINPTIGAHTGPNALGIGFLAGIVGTANGEIGE